MTKQIAIAMPMYNESDGILQTLTQINEAFHSASYKVELFIQDDCSTDNSFETVTEIGKFSSFQIHLEKNRRNVGHGPTTQRAYQRALESACDLVMQLDSDGQFVAAELPALAQLCSHEVPIVIGARRSRTDPWYRKVLTNVLKIFLQISVQCKSSDPNSPVRVYDKNTLKALLSKLPENAMIPNIYLTISANDFDIPVHTLIVSHAVRSGTNSQGTMWRNKSRIQIAIPRRLISFSARAFLELMHFVKDRKRR
jgi:glycosyltransferase involved in cell wall biosynthesis